MPKTKSEHETETVTDDTETEHEAPAAPEKPKPAGDPDKRSALVAALRNSGATGDQAEGVVTALDDYLG
jgi:hypothetical protein